MDIAINQTLLTDFRLGYYRYNIITSKYDQDVEFANDTLDIPGLNTGRLLHQRLAGILCHRTLPGGQQRSRSYGDRPERQPLQLPTD